MEGVLSEGVLSGEGFVRALVGGSDLDIYPWVPNTESGVVAVASTLVIRERVVTWK